MAWDQLWIDKPHLAYALIGFFTTTFSLISLFVKEKLYIGEATVATIFGVIVGPHCLDWFSPTTWGNTDRITLEIARIVLVVQIFAVAVELPKKYMLKHWQSVFMLLIPIMTIGWFVASALIYALIPSLSWIEGLAIAACVTATDPILASAVVGKGKFARRVPGHLRNILSAESGCNDGMAFPFIYMAVNLIAHPGKTSEIAYHFIVITILYECVFGCVLGVVIGYCGRHAIKFAEKHNLIDRESFLVFYFVLALFCTGVGSIIGVDDLLVAFAAGAAFSWDGWFAKRTEETHVSNVIDLLLNMAFFVYFGAIVPWDQFNQPELGITPWRLVILAILILLVRRIPAVLAFKPLIPDIKTWREALFCGHFGPIGVGAIFASILARAELEHEDPTPMAKLPPAGSHNYEVVAAIWPVACFLIIASIVVHGSSIAVFTLGKRLNNMTITMSVTTAGNNNQSWITRLPRLDTTGRSLSLHKIDTTDLDFNPLKSKKNKKNKKIKKPSKFGDHHHIDYDESVKDIDLTTGTTGVVSTAKPIGGMKKRKRYQRVGENKEAPVSVPIDLSQGRKGVKQQIELSEKTGDENEDYLTDNEKASDSSITSTTSGAEQIEKAITPSTPATPAEVKERERIAKVSSNTLSSIIPAGLDEQDHAALLDRINNSGPQFYKEGQHIIIEDSDGEVITTVKTGNSTPSDDIQHEGTLSPRRPRRLSINSLEKLRSASFSPIRRRSTKKTDKAEKDNDSVLSSTGPSPIGSSSASVSGYANTLKSCGHDVGRKHTVYRVDNELVVENDEGEVVRRYRINSHHGDSGAIVAEDGSSASRSNKPGSILGKTLSLVGLKRLGSAAEKKLSASQATSSVSATQSQAARNNGLTGLPDLEMNGLLLEPVVDEQGSNNSVEDDMRDEFLDRKVQKMMASKAKAPPRHPDIEEDDESEEESEEEQSDEEEIDSESESGEEDEAQYPEQPMDMATFRRRQLTGLSGNLLAPLRQPNHAADSQVSILNGDDDEEETEVERKRRLAALGITE
ncbi:hypothetical protein NADFUDRAFT_42495 [Nadsonia fulvescens var. elongata DSM 6958]|uniref:Na+/H+ antiporter n=1 Tax=Nadsonia fulvescens var. elongata DSM 6958 TaxID=857566 RepID=A0A1E3PK45_9ASCO|nr:hypothetical protein NADFUDRAFT_42495 [Nadsonia fulvescens var. elongata DSM 6958]